MTTDERRPTRPTNRFSCALTLTSSTFCALRSLGPSSTSCGTIGLKDSAVTSDFGDQQNVSICASIDNDPCDVVTEILNRI